MSILKKEMQLALSKARLLEIKQSFSKAAKHYEQAAAIQTNIAESLLSRLAYLKIAPKKILDLGCGTGWVLEQLKTHYPKAQLIGLDCSMAMLKQHPRGWFKQPRVVAGDMRSLPFADHSLDLIVSNQAIHWAGDLAQVFNEVARVLSPTGVFLFSTLGPDTFKELKQAWAQADRHTHVNDFADMHDVGDGLLRSGLVDPVMDMEYLTVTYPSVRRLCQELKAQGVKNISQHRREGLVSRGVFQKFEQAYQTLADQAGRLPLSYEVVHGHAWGRRLIDKTQNDVVIPISSIGRMDKKS